MRFPKIPKRVRFPVWSVRTITLTALSVLAVTAIAVFALGTRSLFVETELTLAIVAAALFVFLSVGLYQGARVRRWDLPAVEAKGVSFDDIAQNLPDALDVGGGVPDVDAEGCFGSVVAAMLALVAGLLLLVLLWLLLNFGVVLWVFLLAAVSWVFYLALRQVFAKSRVCRGNLGASLGYALLYTLLYTGWLFAVVWIADGLIGRRLGAG